MTKKMYTILNAAIKLDGVELAKGEDVALEPSQAERLLGTFVEEKAAAAPKASAATVKGGKGTDGL